jgi:hypothetical protein
LRLSERKKLAEELYHQLIAWGDDAIRNGNRVSAECFYQQAEHCLHLSKGPELEVINGSTTLPTLSEKEASSYKKPNLRLIQGGLSLPALSPNVEEPPAGQLPQIVFSSQMSEEERRAIYQRMKMKAMQRSQNRLNKAAKRLHPYPEQDHYSLPGGEETQETPEGFSG